MIATAPVQLLGSALRLDVKFVEGMRAHRAEWPGKLRCILWDGAAHIPFGATYAPEDLGFELQVLPEGTPITAMHLQGAGLVFAAADSTQVLHLPQLLHGTGTKLVYSIEYILETRLQIARLDRGKNAIRRGWSMLWNVHHERRRRAALRAADGLQANGYPAFDLYAPLNRNPLLYLDGRMRRVMMATADEMARRAARLRSGAPLRLIHSGRLEPMKGAQDLVPIMQALADLGVAATLDIYGTGSLAPEIRARASSLGGAVRLHDPVDFETALVPLSRSTADIFVSCHRQSDPSCTYLEAMGCGLPIVGYANRMWGKMAQASGGGLAVSMGNIRALADQIAAWHHDPEALVTCAQSALAFSQRHDFTSEFSRRMAHLKQLAQA